MRVYLPALQETRLTDRERNTEASHNSLALRRYWWLI